MEMNATEAADGITDPMTAVATFNDLICVHCPDLLEFARVNAPFNPILTSVMLAPQTESSSEALAMVKLTNSAEGTKFRDRSCHPTPARIDAMEEFFVDGKKLKETFFVGPPQVSRPDPWNCRVCS